MVEEKEPEKKPRWVFVPWYQVWVYGMVGAFAIQLWNWFDEHIIIGWH